MTAKETKMPTMNALLLLEPYVAQGSRHQFVLHQWLGKTGCACHPQTHVRL